MFLEALPTLDDGTGRYHCVLVDNSGDYEPSESVVGLVRDSVVSIIRPASNLGYFNGAQFALAQYAGAVPKWVVLCNADLTIQRDFLARLLSLEEPQTTAVLAPSVVSVPDGEERNPHMAKRPTVAAMQLRRVCQCNPVLRRLYFALYRTKRALLPFLPSWAKRRPGGRDRRVIYAAVGCCLIFNRRYFEAGATLQHPTLLFGEEVTVAENVRDLGLKIVFEPSLKTRHSYHSRTDRDPMRARCQKESLAVLTDRYFPLFPRDRGCKQIHTT
jgi:GT2 family glycosyltransferase